MVGPHLELVGGQSEASPINSSRGGEGFREELGPSCKLQNTDWL